jgi:hypothetical protein
LVRSMRSKPPHRRGATASSPRRAGKRRERHKSPPELFLTGAVRFLTAKRSELLTRGLPQQLYRCELGMTSFDPKVNLAERPQFPAMLLVSVRRARLRRTKGSLGFPIEIGCEDPRSQTRDLGHPLMVFVLGVVLTQTLEPLRATLSTERIRNSCQAALDTVANRPLFHRFSKYPACAKRDDCTGHHHHRQCCP